MFLIFYFDVNNKLLFNCQTEKKMKVYYNYLPEQFSNTKEIFKEWRKLISSSDFTLGKYVDKFEKKFQDYIKVKHCISTNTGTDALIIALKSLGIKK